MAICLDCLKIDPKRGLVYFLGTNNGKACDEYSTPFITSVKRNISSVVDATDQVPSSTGHLGLVNLFINRLSNTLLLLCRFQWFEIISSSSRSVTGATILPSISAGSIGLGIGMYNMRGIVLCTPRE